jgi:hypothetical protein
VRSDPVRVNPGLDARVGVGAAVASAAGEALTSGVGASVAAVVGTVGGDEDGVTVELGDGLRAGLHPATRARMARRARGRQR